MNKIIDAAWRRLAIGSSVSDSHRLSGIRLAAAALAVMLQSTAGIAQGSDNGRDLIDAATNPRAYYPYPHEQLRPGDVRRVLRDWGLRLLSGPTRTATSYQAIVKDDAGQELFVAIDPQDGAISRLDLTERAVGSGGLFSSIPSGRAADAPIGEGIRPQPAKPPASAAQARPKARVATRMLSPPEARRAPVAERPSSRRVAAVEPPTEIRRPARAAATPSVSRAAPRFSPPTPAASLARPHSKPAPATAVAPPKAGAGGRPEISTAAPASGQAPSAAAVAPAAAPPAPKVEKPSTKPQMPADAGFD